MNNEPTTAITFSPEEKLLEFVSFCIEMYAKKHKQSGADVVVLFENNGVFEYLEKAYDMLHTQGENYIVCEIEEFLEAKC